MESCSLLKADPHVPVIPNAQNAHWPIIDMYRLHVHWSIHNIFECEDKIQMWWLVLSWNCLHGPADKLQICNKFVLPTWTSYLFFCDSDVSSLHVAGVRFSLRGTTYQNNSLVNLEDISEGADALLCVTDLTACCRPPYTDSIARSALGNWFLPNGTRVPSSGNGWEFHRTRDQSVVRLQRRRGGEEGIYSCEIPDAMGVIQTIYIGVYSRTNTQAGEYSQLAAEEVCR